MEIKKKKGIFQSPKLQNLIKTTHLRLCCIGSCLLRCICPFDTSIGKNISKHKDKIKDIAFYFTLSFCLGLSKINLGITPFGLSLLCASSSTSTISCFCGVALSSLFSGTKGIVSLITYFLIFLIRKSSTNSGFDERYILRCAMCFFSSLFIGACNMAGENQLGGITWLTYISFVILSTSCAYLFCPLFSAKDKFPSGLYTMSLYSVCVCLVPFFNRISLPFFDIGLIFAGYVTLLFSKQRGPVYGCVCGFLTGFSCSNPLLSAPLGIAAITSGYLFTKSKTISSICFCSVSFFAFVYLFGTSFAFSKTCEVIISALLFTITANLWPNIFSLDKYEESKGRKVSQSGKTEYDKVSESLSGMSAILYKFAEHMKSPCATETALLFDSVLDDVCKSCSMSEMCYAKRNTNLKAVRSKVVSILSSGRITKDTLSHLFLDKCIKIPELCDNLNAKYSELNFITQKSNRTQTVACLYNSMSHLIKSTSKNESNRKVRDPNLEKCIGEALTKVGIDFGFIVASGTRCKEIEIHKIRADKIPCTSKELCDYLSDKCKILFSEPTFDISDSADMVMKFTRREDISVEYAQCSSAKSSTGVNGDTTCFFDTDKGYFYCIIADGMGSGKTAAATSRLSCVFLEKMLKAGASKNVCLEMLNNLLLSKNDETFSGIDLLEIDKLCGKAYFIKAGAAPSFVLRNSRLYKISSQTPPVGIIHSFSAESTRFSLEKNDVIIMMSDGVIDCDSDGLWLSELIHIDKEAEPSLMAKEMIDKAKSVNPRGDDASACVIRIT